jgi:hypothetical protein
MTTRRLEALQWLGLVAGGLAWAAQHVVGYGLTEAECNRVGARWDIANDPWQLALGTAAVLAILGAEAAAITVFLRTRDADYDGGSPPAARMQMLAIAAMVANVIFLWIVILSSLGAVAGPGCRGA